MWDVGFCGERGVLFTWCDVVWCGGGREDVEVENRRSSLKGCLEQD